MQIFALSVRRIIYYTFAPDCRSFDKAFTKPERIIEETDVWHVPNLLGGESPEAAISQQEKLVDRFDGTVAQLSGSIIGQRRSFILFTGIYPRPLRKRASFSILARIERHYGR